MVVKMGAEFFLVLEAAHYKPGKGQALVRTRLKNFKTGQVFEKNLKADEPIERPYFERRDAVYLYRTGESYVFMDSSTYEQHAFSREFVGNASDLLKENTDVALLVVDGEILGVELPNFLTLKVVEAPPGIRGDTATGGTKNVKVETGASIQVPLFVQEGDFIQIDTRTREYVKRVG